MKHRAYSFLSEQITSNARKAGMITLPKKQRNIAGILKGLSATFLHVPTMRETMDCLVCAEEIYWMQNGKRVYFMEDIDIAKSIQRGSFNITTATPLYQGAESFVLMLPHKLAFAGNSKGGGLLVTIFKHDERGDKVFNDFFDAIGHPRAQVESVGDLGDFTVCVCYQQGDNRYEYCRIAMPSHSIEDCMGMDSYADYAAYQQKHNKFNFIGGIDLSLAESQYQFDLMRLVLGFLIYRAALPERIVEGLPGFNPKDATTQYIKQVNTAHIKHPHNTKQSINGHYRTWHFRQLNDEKYYRGEHKHKEIGSRIVFVQDSFIGDVSAATAAAEANYD